MIKSFNIGRIWIPTFQNVMDVAYTNGYATPSYAQLMDMNRIHRVFLNDGIIQQSEVLYIFKNNSGSSNFSRINHINPSSYLLGEVGSPVHSATRGYSSAGSGSYLTTGFALNAGVHISIHNIAMATHVDASFNAAEVAFGFEDVSGGRRTFIVPRNGGNCNFAINGFSDATVPNGGTFVAGSSQHYFYMERSAITTSKLRVDDTTDNASTNSSTVLTAITMDLLCFKNYLGVRSGFLTSAYLSHFWIGSTLSGADVTSFYNEMVNFNGLYV